MRVHAFYNVLPVLQNIPDGVVEVGFVRSLYPPNTSFGFPHLRDTCSCHTHISAFLPTDCGSRVFQKAHIFECVRFVKSLQRRRARVVEARKRRWDPGKIETGVRFFLSLV